MGSPGITALALVCFAGPYDQSFSPPMAIEPAVEVTDEGGAAINEDDSAPKPGLTMRQKHIFVLGLAAQEKK
jgi:hypothetical protein